MLKKIKLIHYFRVKEMIKKDIKHERTAYTFLEKSQTK